MPGAGVLENSLVGCDQRGVSMPGSRHQDSIRRICVEIIGKAGAVYGDFGGKFRQLDSVLS